MEEDFYGCCCCCVCLRAFEVEEDFYGELRRRELMPGGSRVAVTAENRALYVEVGASHCRLALPAAGCCRAVCV